MRSFILKAALAAVLLSTSFVTAYAAGTTTAPPLDPLQKEADQNHGALADVDSTWTGSTAKPATTTMPATTMPAKPMAEHKAEYRPRLTHIVDQLGATNHRIRVDHNRGYLTVAEMRHFDARSHEIRKDAMRIADDHRGALPEERYAALQHRVNMLNHDIHHAATT